MPARKPKQLGLTLSTWGGARPGAGRKPKGAEAGVPHAPRARITRHLPAHVTLRMEPHVWNLRSGRSFRVIGCALAAGCERPGFRVVHFSVQGNHIHLLVEADAPDRLARGMQALSIRIARALNRVMGRRGRVFTDRYHVRVLQTPREVRHCLCYVLNNFRRHAAQRGERLGPRWMDPYSSAAHFDGWQEGVGAPAAAERRLVAEPRTWLVRTGWRRCGLIAPSEIPAGDGR